MVETDFAYLCFFLSCQILDKQFDIAKEQLDFLKEIQGGQVNKAEILYMSSLLGRYTQTNSGKNSFHVQYSINHLFFDNGNFFRGSDEPA